MIELVSLKLSPAINVSSLARGVHGLKLKHILEYGIDVEPTNAPNICRNDL